MPHVVPIRLSPAPASDAPRAHPLHIPCKIGTSLFQMSVGSPTLLPRSALFPNVLPKPPQPHPLPLPRYGQQPARFNATRDLAREMEDLSEEEDDLDDLVRC